jgi:hypothetical protein
MKKLCITCVAIVLVFISWSQASADYMFSYVSNDTTVNISGILNTASNGPGPLQVTGGSFGIFTLLPGVSNSPAGVFSYDNQLSPGSAPMLTTNGLLFTVDTLGNPGYKEINIWGNSAAVNDYTYMEWTAAAGYTADLRGTFSVEEAQTNSVAEPSTMLLLGFGVIGLGVAARRKFGK